MFQNWHVAAELTSMLNRELAQLTLNLSEIKARIVKKT